MDFFDVTAQRGSYRGEFLDAPIPEADLRKILQAAIQAPSGYNFQTTTFAVVTDKALLQALAALMPMPATQTAPAIIVALSEHVVQKANGLSFETEDYAAATENLLLAATALGYGAVWMDGMTKLHGNAEKIKALLNIPAGKTVRTIVPLGKPKEPVAQREKKPLSERVTFYK